MTGFFGVPIRNSLGIGLGGVASVSSAAPSTDTTNDLLMETGDFLLLEDGGKILLE